MSKNVPIKEIEVNLSKQSFMSKILGDKKQKLSDIKILRNLLSNEKAKILHLLKTQEISSIYQLSKILKKDFKSVREDTKILEKFGIISFQSVKKGKRKSLKPVLSVEKLQISINI